MEIINIHFSEVDSTNTWSRQNYSSFDRNKITLVTADSQTAGRGRFNRYWKSPAGQNLYATFNFCVALDRSDIGNIPLILAISTCETIENFDLIPQLKWPNDILLSNKKVGGILCEVIEIDNMLGIILGIGLNINMPDEQLKLIDQPATSLFNEKKMMFKTDLVLRILCENFEKNIQDFLKDGFSVFLEKYRTYLQDSIGKKIHYYNGISRENGVLHSLNPDGSINIFFDSGEIKKVSSGEIYSRES